jgi:hypothetical protein
MIRSFLSCSGPVAHRPVGARRSLATAQGSGGAAGLCRRSSLDYRFMVRAIRLARKGLQRLEQAGIQVESGLLESEARALNPGFGLPYLRCKLAMCSGDDRGGDGDRGRALSGWLLRSWRALSPMPICHVPSVWCWILDWRGIIT